MFPHQFTPELLKQIEVLERLIYSDPRHAARRVHQYQPPPRGALYPSSPLRPSQLTTEGVFELKPRLRIVDQEIPLHLLLTTSSKRPGLCSRLLRRLLGR